MVTENPRTLNIPPNDPQWRSAAVTRLLLNPEVTIEPGRLLDWAKRCAERIRVLRDRMRNQWVGLNNEGLGYLTDWIIACAIARENCLLLGIPGVAKSEIATQFFKWLQLNPPDVNQTKLQMLDSPAFNWKSWESRKALEEEEQKYFHYLLSRFTQVEELFGPIELELLKKGIVTRVNFGLLTGPGVYAAFLDEVFKASSSVLNTLLTLTQERAYFSWGGMVPSDLVMFIAASNEMPGGFATGASGQGNGNEDFQTLHAFLDRFPVRIEIPNASGTSNPGESGVSDLAKAFDLALKREEQRFTGLPAQSSDAGVYPPCVNDILLLGRACLQGLNQKEPLLFDLKSYQSFKICFMNIACSLQAASGTNQPFAQRDRITWTITPRKLKSIFKIALALAVVRDDSFVPGDKRLVQGPKGESLRVFDMIWDSPYSRSQLHNYTKVEYQNFKRYRNE
ncbi:MAG TPA: AAA family ATPase [Bacillota bacterium]|nr:AAA family ATPase [Bacillota bacterium]